MSWKVENVRGRTSMEAVKNQAAFQPRSYLTDSQWKHGRERPQMLWYFLFRDPSLTGMQVCVCVCVRTHTHTPLFSFLAICFCPKCCYFNFSLPLDPAHSKLLFFHCSVLFFKWQICWSIYFSNHGSVVSFFAYTAPLAPIFPFWLHENVFVFFGHSFSLV